MLTDSTWIMLTAFLVAANCSLVGTFLMLRQQSMVGDAIAHAVLPGMVVVFLLTGQLGRKYMFIGALLAALLATVIISFLHHQMALSSGVAIGITFTSFFALGLLLVARYTQKVDLDQQCVLFGKLEHVPSDLICWSGYYMPQPTLWLAALLVVNLAALLVAYPMLTITSFDPTFATVLGAPVAFSHYLLLSLTALTTVVAIKVIGAILVVAFIILPPATAYLLTDRLSLLLQVALCVDALMAVGGLSLAQALNTSVAGSTVMAGGILFALAFGHALLAGNQARQ